MEISPLLLTELLLDSFLFGATIGAFNDINRIIRIFFGLRYSSLDSTNASLKLKRSTRIFFNVIVFVQDFLLVLFSTAGIILLNYYYNDGKNRLFAVLAMILGFVLYFFTLGKLFMFLSEPIVLFVRSVISILVRIILAPFKFIFRILKRILEKTYTRIKKHIEKRINIRYNRREVNKLKILSKYGFINLSYKDSKNEG